MERCTVSLLTARLASSGIVTLSFPLWAQFVGWPGMTVGKKAILIKFKRRFPLVNRPGPSSSLLIGWRKGMCKDSVSPDWLGWKVFRFSPLGEFCLLPGSSVGGGSIDLYSAGFLLWVCSDGSGWGNYGLRWGAPRPEVHRKRRRPSRTHACCYGPGQKSEGCSIFSKEQCAYPDFHVTEAR